MVMIWHEHRFSSLPLDEGQKLAGTEPKLEDKQVESRECELRCIDGLQGGSIVDQVISAQETNSLNCTRYTQMTALYCISNIWNLHMNARVFRLILGHAFERGDALREGREKFFMSRAILPSFLSVWILVDKKGSEDCDVGHGTSAANPILISEEQKSKEWVWRFVIGPPPYRRTHHCLTASFRLLGRRTKTVGAHSETQSLICT